MRGLTAYPPSPGMHTQILPLAGISHATTVYCNELGQYTIYQRDEHGFHNPGIVVATARRDCGHR